VTSVRRVRAFSGNMHAWHFYNKVRPCATNCPITDISYSSRHLGPRNLALSLAVAVRTNHPPISSPCAVVVCACQTGRVLTAAHPRKSGALERTLLFVRFSFRLHPPNESTFVSRSIRQLSGETNGRTRGLSSGHTLASKTQLGSLSTVLLPLLQFL